MEFWILITVITFIATLVVILPMARAKKQNLSSVDFEKNVYKARLNEIEKDRASGRISQEMAESAISDEGRKLIRLANAEKNTAAKILSNTSRNFALIVSLVAIPLAALAIYLSIGSPSIPDQSLAMRLKEDPSNQSISDLIARAEAHLSKNPNDARGWAVVAPVYTRMQRYDDAVMAYANVYRLAPDTPGIRSTLAESMMAVSQGVITDRARRLFDEELKLNPASAKARFYIAMALGQEGKDKQAVAAWDALIAGGNAQSPWMSAARNFRDISAEKAGIASLAPIAPKPAQPGPTAEQVEAASQMTSKDRQEMISGMVAGLAEKLKDNPTDQQGWQRLIRAYMVLGRKKDALEAITSAKNANQNSGQFLEVLDKLETSLQ